MGPVALVGQRYRRRDLLIRRRGEDASELPEPLTEHPAQPIGAEPRDVIVERVDPHAEGHLPLELGPAAGEDEVSAFLAAFRDLLEQACLADPRFAAQGDEGRPPTAETLEGRRQHR